MGFRVHHQLVAGGSLPNGYGVYDGVGTSARDFCYHSFVQNEENRLMCEECTLSLGPNVAKAVKTASAIHPNQDGVSCYALHRPALVCMFSLPTLGHSGSPAVGVLFFWLP